MNLEEQEEKIWNFSNGNKVWFTSDTHFGHENIIRFCNRPFDNVNEMNETLIKNWNSIVKPDDTVFHLGDFAFGGSAIWNSILDVLNGNIILIKGNHDRKNLKQGFINKFLGVYSQLQILVEGQSIYLNHYPFLCYGGTYRNNPVWQLFGHVHSGPYSSGKDTKRLINLFPTQYDVGVDNNYYYPVNFNEVKDKIEKQIQLWMKEKNE